MKKSIYLFSIFVVVLLVQIENIHAATQESSNSVAILKAAEQGDARAQVSAGVMYHSGKDVQKDYAQAARKTFGLTWICLDLGITTRPEKARAARFFRPCRSL